MRIFCFENNQDFDWNIILFTVMSSACVFYHLFLYLNPDGKHPNVQLHRSGQKERMLIQEMHHGLGQI